MILDVLRKIVRSTQQKPAQDVIKDNPAIAEYRKLDDRQLAFALVEMYNTVGTIGLNCKKGISSDQKTQDYLKEVAQYAPALVAVAQERAKAKGIKVPNYEPSKLMSFPLTLGNGILGACETRLLELCSVFPGVDKDFAERNKAWRDGKDFVQSLGESRKLVEKPYSNIEECGSGYPFYIDYPYNRGDGYSIYNIEPFTKPGKMSSIGIYSEQEMAIRRAKIERACRNL